MKKYLLTFLVALISLGSFAQEWVLDKAHANVSFSIVHLKISEVDGKFETFDAKVTSAKEDFTDAVFEFTGDIASINTGNKFRDNDLRSDNYFDAEKFPAMTFKSTSISHLGGTKYKLTGNMTIKGVTKPITLDAVIRGPIEVRGSKKIGIKADGVINRIDFGVGKSGPVLDDEVVFKVSGEFNLK